MQLQSNPGRGMLLLLLVLLLLAAPLLGGFDRYSCGGGGVVMSEVLSGFLAIRPRQIGGLCLNSLVSRLG